MKKALGQTVRDLKRGVNKKVLKIPGLERKVLDATSNEAWGPHGSHLAEIAQASKNQAEFQMIMGVLWKRLSDTGKNWRHVYKALIVLEYLVANGSERVIDEIKEHAHQISTLSEFQYVDSSGRDQGSNVRRKSQSLVFLVTDKERVQEARQKASANRDKFGKPGDYSSPGAYGDQYNEENQTGYGKDDRYGRYGDSVSRDGDRSDRESEARYSRDGSVDDEHQVKERNRSADRDGTHADDDGYSSSRGSGVRHDDYSQDGRNDNQRCHEKNPGDPPSYEEVVSKGRTSSVHSERGGDGDVSVTAPSHASPPAAGSTTHSDTNHGTSEPSVTNDPVNFDDFDPRGPKADPAMTSNGNEVDLLGSLSDSFLPDDAAHIRPSSAANPGVGMMDTGSGANFSATFSSFNQPFEDPFGDTPFKATPSTDSGPTQAQNPPAFQSTMNQGFELAPAQSFAQKSEGLSTFDYGTPFGNVSYTPPTVPHDQFSSANTQMVPSGFHDQEIDILAGILPPSGYEASPSAASVETSQAPPVQSFQATDAFGGYHQQAGAAPSASSYFGNQSPSRQNATTNNDFFSHQGFTASSEAYMDSQLATHQHNQPNDGNFGGDFFQQLGSSVPTTMHPNGQKEPESHNYGGVLQQSGSNMQATSPIAPGSPFRGNTQHVANSVLPQQPSFPLSTSPVASQGQKETDAQTYNGGFFQHSASSVPVASEPNAHHDSGGLIQQHSVQQLTPVQNVQDPQSSNDDFFRQQYTSAVTGATHAAPGFSYPSTGQQKSGGFLQQAGSSQGNPSLNSHQPGSPQITPQGQKEQNHPLQSEFASVGTSHMGLGISYTPNSQQNTGGFHQQPASSLGNSPSNPQQPSSMFMAPDMMGQNPQQPNSMFMAPDMKGQNLQQPNSMFMAPDIKGQNLQQPNSMFMAPDMEGQNPQHYSSGFPNQHPPTASGSPVMAPVSTYPSTGQQNNGGFFQQQGLSVGNSSVHPQGHAELTAQNYNGGFLHQKQESQVIPGQSYAATGQNNGGNFHPASGPSQFSPRHVGTETPQSQNSNGIRGVAPQKWPTNQISSSQNSANSTVGPLALVPQPTKDKFETKSTVWADTLSRGLVNLNISGSKTNPLADIGIDFDAINRKEKRMEKPAATPVVSTVSMGKAMGSGSGIGRSGASALRPSATASSMMNPGTSPGFGPGSSMAGYGGITQQPMGGFGGMNHQQPLGGYGVMNQQQPIGGYGVTNQQQPMGGFGGMNQQQMGGLGGMSQQSMGMGFGMGMNMNMQQPTGLPPGSSYNGGFNPMMGGGGFPSQQPYGGGYHQ